MSMVINSDERYCEGIFSTIKRVFALNEVVEMRIPTDVWKRADLMCMYIQEEVGSQFDIDNLLMLLYMDFVKYAVKNYNPSRVLKEAMRKERDVEGDNALVIQMDGKKYKVNKGNGVKYSFIEVKIPKREYQKGQLILDELEALYGYKIPFEVMLSNLLINFIEDYKEGVNKRAYTSVVKILKKVMNE